MLLLKKSGFHSKSIFLLKKIETVISTNKNQEEAIPFTKRILVMKKLKHSERARLSANRTVGETYG